MGEKISKTICVWETEWSSPIFALHLSKQESTYKLWVEYTSNSSEAEFLEDLDDYSRFDPDGELAEHLTGQYEFTGHVGAEDGFYLDYIEDWDINSEHYNLNPVDDEVRQNYEVPADVEFTNPLDPILTEIVTYFGHSYVTYGYIDQQGPFRTIFSTEELRKECESLGAAQREEPGEREGSLGLLTAVRCQDETAVKDCFVAARRKRIEYLMEKALFLAAWLNNVRIMKLIIEKTGVNHVFYSENFRCFPGSALSVAIGQGNLEAVELLLKSGADPDIFSHYSYISQFYGPTEEEELAYQTGFKESALHLAVGIGQKDVVELLLKHGADVNVKDVDDKIPLQSAIEAGHDTIAEILKSADEECVN